MQQIITEQIGFQTKDRKTAVLRDKAVAKFTVKEARSGKVVYSGTTTGPVNNEKAQESNYFADFSDFETPGTYVVAADGMQSSYPFTIGDEVYDEVTHGMLRFFYLQRCGVELPKEYAGDFDHASCHDTPAYIYPSNVFMDVRGGWHDAGDYGRYIVAAAVTVADLLMAYENNPKLFGQKLNIPESQTATPDLLDEVRFELEWMLKMQDPETYVVYHKVTCESFPSLSALPEEERDILVISPPSVTATADFAAVMAMASRFYLEYDEDFSKRCLRAAIKAYAAMKCMFLPGGFKNPKEIVTGEYGDAEDRDEKYWAAAELYKTTGEDCYHDDLKELLKKGMLHGYGWREVGSFGNQAYITTTKYPTDKDLVAEVKESMLEYGRMILKRAENDSYRFSLPEYEWGSNMYVANNAYHLYDAYKITGEEEFLDFAKEQIHYLFGKNANATCFVTGYGTVSPKHPHHRPSEAKHMSMPGMLVGGPDEGFHDPAVTELVKDAPPAKVYIDDKESYSTNEVTIYWNSAILLALSVL